MQPVGVNLAGYLDSMLGLGQLARNVRHALRAAGVPVASWTLPAPSREQIPDAAGEREQPRHAVNLICVNADGMEGARDALGPDYFAGRTTIGLWWWEAGELPDRWLRAFDLLDEVWVGSHHVADVLAPVAPVPVLRMPVPLEPVAPAAVSRAELGLPDGTLFLHVFDHASVFERKNPLGVVEAFTRAFPPGGGAAAVVKSVGADRHPEQHRRLLDAAAGRPDVLVLDEALAPERMWALLAACDCYVSLHRSEGFGLPIAEAMLLGKPVVATAYGGPRDFLDPHNSFPVPYELAPIGPGNEPYPADGVWAEPDLDAAAAALRAVAQDPEDARRRGERGRAELLRDCAPEAAGRAMAARLARLARLPVRADGRVSSLPLEQLTSRIDGGPPPPPPNARMRALRGPLRTALLRLLRPQAVHQRLVDESLVRAIATLDERVQGLAAGQATLLAEVEVLRSRVAEREP